MHMWKSSLFSFGNGVVAAPTAHRGCVNSDVTQLSSITQLHIFDAQAWPWIRKGDCGAFLVSWSGMRMCLSVM